MFGLGAGWTTVIVGVIIVVLFVYLVSKGESDGCGCCLVATVSASLFVWGMIRGCINNKEEERGKRMEQEITTATAERETLHKQEQERALRVHAFWEKEEPSVWTAYQQLKVDIEAKISKNHEHGR